MIKLIVAVGKNNLIGNGDKLAWHVPAELDFFKKTTMNQTLFMGGATFMGLPKTLKGREIIIFHKTDEFPEKKVITSIEEAKTFLKETKKDIFIAGGKFVYETFYKLADELYVSFMKGDYEGDVFLNVDFENLDMTKTLILDDKDFTTYKFERN